MSAIRFPSELELGDGRTVTIRPIQPSDLELERNFVAGLSARTRYLRLLSGRSVQPGELEHWANVDPEREIALVALTGSGPTEEQVGFAQSARDGDDPQRWDFGIVVADAWQGVGLGEALMEHLLASAHAAGIALLSSVTLPENRRMLALARRLGFSIRREAGDATLMRIERRVDDPLAPAMVPAWHALPQGFATTAAKWWSTMGV